MLYNFLKYLFRFILLFLVKIEVVNLDKIPSEGPVLLASNHLSNWDPVVLGVLIPRKLHFMAKEELFKIFLVGSIMRQIGTFPIKRGTADRNAIRQGIKILQNNKVLCLFPEGTRSKTGKLLPFQGGVTLLAHKGNAPLVPIGLIGTNKILTSGFRAKIRLVVGDPIFLKEQFPEGKINSEQLDEITKLLQTRVASLCNS